MSLKQLHKPDFICIGPTKTGTSWLYTVLRLHPELWLPPVSEVNYYWGTGNRLPQATVYKTIKQRIKGDIRIRWRKTYAKQRWEFYAGNPSLRHWRDISWDLKYLFLPQTPSWYKSLFRTNGIAGDITGGYFLYDDQAIRQLAAQLPNTKILMTFRDPVSRLWSEAKMILMFLPRKTFEQVSEADFYRRFDRAIQRLPSYYGLYNRWLKHFPEEQILTSYYDDLLNDPHAYLRRICNFLNVSDTLTAEMQLSLHEKVFEGPRTPLPEHFRKYLIIKTMPSVKELAEKSGHPQPLQWLEKYQQYLDGAKISVA